jgi:hypothetical protein
MNCDEFQEQLSDYLERALGGAQTAVVEEHLAGCPPCREEAELLVEIIAQVAALPPVDPPLGFAQRVMAQVRELETEPGYWQWFVSALRQNIPIQGAALVTVAVLGTYLLVKEGPLDPSTSLPPHQITGDIKGDPKPTGQAALVPPSERDQLAALSKRTAGPSTNEGSSSRALEPRATGGSGGARNSEKVPAKSADRKPPAPATTVPVAPSRASTPEKTSASAPRAGEGTPEPNERTAPMITGTTVASHSSSQLGGSPATLSFPFESDNPGALRSAPIEPFADFELIVRRHPPELGERRSDPAGTLRRAEAGKTSAERPSAPRAIDRLMAAIPDHSRPQTIWVTVPINQYEQFKDELHALGTIESEFRVPLLRDRTAAQGDGHIRVKLMALPTPDNATPNTPANR